MVWNPFAMNGENSWSSSYDGIAKELTKRLFKAQKGLTEQRLRAKRSSLQATATALVELTDDIRGGVGIWTSLEQANTRFFGTPLPFLVEPGATLPPKDLTPERVQHFLWVLYGLLFPNLYLAPDHPDIALLANVATEALRDGFAAISRDSDIKDFLATPNSEGWIVKKKLVWLGTQSFLFTLPFRQYFRSKDAKTPAITATDDFVCQQCTEWSGLGALEVLAGCLKLRPAERADLLTWSQRHQAVYKVLGGDKQRLEVLNVINDQKYRVWMDLDKNPFQVGQFVTGSLVPWGGEWIWSGAQTALGPLTPADIEPIQRQYRLHSNIYYRYSPGALKQARRLVDKMGKDFRARHGKDLVIFPDARALADDWKAVARGQIEAMAPADRRRLRERGDLDRSLELQLPPEISEAEGSIAVYFNPGEGQESFGNFGLVLNALAQQGANLSAEQAEMTRELVLSPEISPGFVRELAKDYGVKSILAAFGLAEQRQEYALEYLLRRHKGHFFRPRYPSLSFVD